MKYQYQYQLLQIWPGIDSLNSLNSNGGVHLKASDNLRLTYRLTYGSKRGQQGEAVEPGTCRTSAARSCAARRRAAKVACKRVQLRRASSWYLWKLDQKPRESWTKNLGKVEPKNTQKPNQTVCVCVFFGNLKLPAVFFKKIRNLQGNLYGLIWDVWMFPFIFILIEIAGVCKNGMISGSPPESGNPKWFSCQYRLQAQKKTYSTVSWWKNQWTPLEGSCFFCFGEGFRSFYQSQI